MEQACSPALVQESPGTLACILELGLVSPGISHSALRPQLGLDQPQMSKIAEKLLDGGLIRVATLETDRRVKLITATAAGRTLLSSLKMKLNALLPAQGVRQTSSRQPRPSRPATGRSSRKLAKGPSGPLNNSPCPMRKLRPSAPTLTAIAPATA